MEIFDPKIHVCKFFFQQHDTFAEITNERLLQRISGDLYQNEIKIELMDGKENVKKVFGYILGKVELSELLPLLHWDEFEKTREDSVYRLKYSNGYRDGWGYEFACLNEGGYPLIEHWMTDIYDDKYKPAYEKLLDWIINTYSGCSEYKKLRLLW